MVETTSFMTIPRKSFIYQYDSWHLTLALILLASATLELQLMTDKFSQILLKRRGLSLYIFVMALIFTNKWSIIKYVGGSGLNCPLHQGWCETFEVSWIPPGGSNIVILSRWRCKFLKLQWWFVTYIWGLCYKYKAALCSIFDHLTNTKKINAKIYIVYDDS